MFRKRRNPNTPRSEGLSINRMIPNILTLLALCAGLTAIRFGLQEKWEAAVVSIILAAILDGLDGRVARLLGVTSKFGAELDSLSDFVSFGVSPAMLLYFWTMRNAESIGWALVLLFSVSCAFRLARFNTMIGDPDLPPWAYNFFTGVPAPAGAGLVILPIVLSFEFGEEFFRHPGVAAIFLIGVAFLMVSRIPTFSFKKFKIPRPLILPMLLGVGLLAAFLVSAPWITLGFFGLVYLFSIPLSIRSFGILKRNAMEIQGANKADNQSP